MDRQKLATQLQKASDITSTHRDSVRVDNWMNGVQHLADRFVIKATLRASLSCESCFVEKEESTFSVILRPLSSVDRSSGAEQVQICS